MGLFDGLDNINKRVQILRAPFAYPGGKSRSVEKILPHLPTRKIYIEPFGGSGAVLLAKEKSKLEVFNDRYAGVVAFYRCIRDPALLAGLVAWLENTVHAKEEFYWCKETWENVDDPVERAARWYYMMQSSFGSIGRNWGRQTNKSSMAGKVRNKLTLFPKIHQRFKNVQVENLDWEECLQQYDSSEAVIYCDPPYLDVHRGTYKNEMNPERHREFLDAVHNCKSYVAVSGYSTPLYESYPWSKRIEWNAFVSIKSVVNTVANSKAGADSNRTRATEVLWIKENQ